MRDRDEFLAEVRDRLEQAQQHYNAVYDHRHRQVSFVPEDPYREQEVAAADAYESEGKFHQPLRERLHPCEDV